MVRKKLGRGINALLGGASPVVLEPEPSVPEVVEDSPAGTLEVEIDRIDSNPYQPRLEFDADALQELADSIRQHGLLEPLLVRHSPTTEGRYQLIAGERRLRASRQAGMERVPVLFREVEENQMLEVAIVENVQRENLNPIEEAHAYQMLMQQGGNNGEGMTQAEVADRVGKKRATIANLLRLLELPPAIQEAIRMNQITQGHGKVLLGVPPEHQMPLFFKAIRENLSVRNLELEADKMSSNEPENPQGGVTSKRKKKDSQKNLDVHLASVQEALCERLGTKVQLTPKKDGSGVVEIHYFNSEDLDRLLESLDIEL